MASKKERARRRNATAAPVSAGLEFVPIELTAEQRADEVCVAFLDMVDEGVLSKWELGRKGPYLCSRYEFADGDYDSLTSPEADDEDWVSLVLAHGVKLYRDFHRDQGSSA